MKYIPIVAVVSEDTLRLLDHHISLVDELSPQWFDLMERNGWTLASLAAGVLIGQTLTEGYPSVTDETAQP